MDFWDTLLVLMPVTIFGMWIIGQFGHISGQLDRIERKLDMRD